MKRTAKIEKGNFNYPKDLFYYMTLGHQACLLQALKEYRADHYEHDIYIDLEVVGTAFKATLYTGTHPKGSKLKKKIYLLLPEGHRFEVKRGVKRKIR